MPLTRGHTRTKVGDIPIEIWSILTTLAGKKRRYSWLTKMSLSDVNIIKANSKRFELTNNLKSSSTWKFQPR